MDTDAIIDRIDDYIAVIEINGQTFDLPITSLPSGAKEGDTLRIAIAIATTAREQLAREPTSGPEVIDL
jgi:hypothetical protein